MKKRMNLLIACAIVLGITACDKSNEKVMDDSIAGTYIGKLTTTELKGATGVMPGSMDATVEVTKLEENEIHVHCLSDELDTTFMLNYYNNHDSVMVCLEGDAFQEMYGHMLGQGYMMGGMMGDISDGETQWMHHLNDEHQPGDEHYGGFDMMNHTFGYRFSMTDNGTSHMFGFQGSKIR